MLCFTHFGRKPAMKVHFMKVYLVEDCGNSPGRIMAVCHEKEAAEMLADALADLHHYPFDVQERTLIYGQPSLGYND